MVKLIRLKGDQVFVFERIQVSGSVKMKMKQANLIIALFCRSEWFKSEYIEFVRVAYCMISEISRNRYFGQHNSQGEKYEFIMLHNLCNV
jgi:hypothetical protein